MGKFTNSMLQHINIIIQVLGIQTIMNYTSDYKHYSKTAAHPGNRLLALLYVCLLLPVVSLDLCVLYCL